MKLWFHLVWRTLKVFILFTACTIFFYYGMIWINEEYESYHRYDEPKGTAMKVSSHSGTEQPSIIERLLLFYLNGE